jgi:hypothetical protein
MLGESIVRSKLALPEFEVVLGHQLYFEKDLGVGLTQSSV